MAHDSDYRSVPCTVLGIGNGLGMVRSTPRYGIALFTPEQTRHPMMVPQNPSAVRDETLRTIATFPRLPELLDDGQTSNLSPNCGGVNASLTSIIFLANLKEDVTILSLACQKFRSLFRLFQLISKSEGRP